MRKGSMFHLFDIRIMLSVLDSRTLGFMRSFSDILFDMLALGYLYLGINYDGITCRRTMGYDPCYPWDGTGTPVSG